MEKENLITHLDQFRFTFLAHKKAYRFIQKHQVWKGFWEYGWVAKLLVVVAAIVGVKFLSILFNWFSNVEANQPLGMLSSMGQLAGDLAGAGYDLLFLGGMKYVIIVLMEIIIFHACRRTLFLLTGKKGESDLDSFVKAQIRMIQVAIRSFILETICVAILKFGLGMFGLYWLLGPALTLAVQCYFLGFAVMDNYIEQFELTIKESAAYAKKYPGIALGIGLVLHFLLLIPVVGAIIGPFLAAVTVTLVMYELTDLHILGRDSIEGIPENV